MSETNDDLDSIRIEHGIPDTWTDDDVILWFSTVDINQTVKNNNGVFIFDPTRQRRPVNEWSTDELLAYIKGELTNKDRYNWTTRQVVVSDKTVIAEYKRRVVVEPAWTDQQIIDYYREGVTPAKTTTGVWVVDVTRANRKPQQWSDAELIGWLRREISAVGLSTYAKLLAEIVKRKIKDDGVEYDPQ